MTRRRSLPRVLCVDDDPVLLEALSLVLRRDYEVVPAESAEEALAVLAGPPVDAILCDAMLPGLSGLEFLAMARRLQPDAPRLLLTGDAVALRGQPDGPASPVHRVLEKPLPASALVQALAEALERWGLWRTHPGRDLHPDQPG